ncbi:GT2 family glycosyltransferase [Haloactinopolyspora alba]|uniref:GT2 family glycosyltransferase n=1 Tax=Haloactinopolyspora alba TaxID=648780 RepID=A0A2P8D3B3_9ACTN|nr:glycosyltransferase family 2 protein [Haloactinopolyspora alba]PSK91712.1 GT2 family glycosyltransferase [Haloactinopolyspora alba]
MATDPLTATDSAANDSAATGPGPYTDPGVGTDAALDAFAGDMPDSAPVDPTELLTHDVTAVLVGHNGSRWLRETLDALAASQRMPDRILAVDTGSKDETPRLLTDALGAPAVVSADRTVGFGEAVAMGVAAADESARAAYGFGAGGARRTEWVWVLHDDSAPAPDALARLLECAVRHPEAGIIGPKVLDWRDGRQLLEIGLTVTGGGRRHTGLDRREYDQGQHDATREVLAVGSAGMLVRRDVWDELGGFDERLTLFRDDLDLGWRANEAGHAVVVCPDAVVHHAEAAAHGRRRLGATRDRPHLADRRNALYVLLANAPRRALPLVMLRIVLMGLGRSIGFLLGKQPALALEELAALLSAVGRPDKLIRARARRRRTRVRSAGEMRALFPPRGQQLRHTGENVLSMVTGAGGGTGHDVSGGRRAVSESEDDELPESDDTFLLRILLHPAVLLVAGLVVATLVAVRGLIGSGRLIGGALLASPSAAGDVWQVYTESWHGGGLGSAAASPPYLAVLGLVSSVVRNASVAVDLLLLGSVPLAAVTMYLLIRRLVSSKLLRVWVSGTYALLPATTGAIAAGRLGTAVAAVVTPLLVLAVLRTMGTPGRSGPGRAAWSAGLLLALTSAFVPLAWVLAAALGLLALATIFRDRRSLVRVGAMLVVTPVVFVPWTGSVLSDPTLLLTEPGLPGPGLSDTELAPWAVLLQHPGGPGAGPVWLGIGVVLAGWAALFRPDRRLRVHAAWAVAGVALVAGIAVSRLPVSGPTLETPVSGWPGYPAVVVGGALLVAAAIGADGARERLSSASFGWRQPVTVVVVAAAVLTPVAGLGWWVADGAGEPVQRRDPQILPAYVADEAARPDRVRTLVLNTADDGRVTYALLRESGPRLGDAATSPPPEEYGPLDDVVADVVSGRGGADGARLAEFAVRYVYLPAPYDPSLADTLDTVPGLVRASAPEGAAMWEINQPVARVWVAEPPAAGETDAPLADEDAEMVTIPSGKVSASGSIPEGAEGRRVVLSELADSGWTARLDGRELEPTTYAGWAQAFRLGPDGGELTVEYEGNRRAAWLWLQLGAVVVAVVLALPGIRRERGAVDDAADIDLDESSPRLPVPQVATAGASTDDGREPGEAAPGEAAPGEAAPAEPVPGTRRRPGRRRGGTGAPATEQPVAQDPQPAQDVAHDPPPTRPVAEDPQPTGQLTPPPPGWDPFERSGTAGRRSTRRERRQDAGSDEGAAPEQPREPDEAPGAEPVDDDASYRGRRAGGRSDDAETDGGGTYRGRRAASGKRAGGRRAKGRRGGEDS